MVLLNPSVSSTFPSQPSRPLTRIPRARRAKHAAWFARRVVAGAGLLVVSVACSSGDSGGGGGSGDKDSGTSGADAAASTGGGSGSGTGGRIGTGGRTGTGTGGSGGGSTVSGGASSGSGGSRASGGASPGSGGAGPGSGGRAQGGAAPGAGGGPCFEAGTACAADRPECCTGLVCVTSTSPDYAGCRAPCRAAGDCASGCCIPFANMPDEGFCGDAILCQCAGLNEECGGTRRCCDGFTCTTYDDTRVLGCRPVCNVDADCDTNCCIAIPGTSDSACFQAAWCGR